MRENEFQKEFLKIMDKFSRKYSKWQIWNDFLYLAAVSLANTVPAPERAEREKRYLEMINKYEKEYHMLNLHQEQKGQFFTPYDISRFMAKLQMADRDLEQEKKGKDYITVHDPACGAGALLIAFANEAKKQGINYQQEVLIANALAQKYKSGDDQFGMKFVELAETAAVGRALSDAGFGLQFADREMDFDPEVTEAPLDEQILMGETPAPELLNEEMVCDPDSVAGGGEMMDNNLPGQYNIEEYIPMPDEIGFVMQQQGNRTAGVPFAPAPKQPQSQPAPRTPQNTYGQQTKSPSQASQGNKPVSSGNVSEIKTNMPVEEIYKMLNREKAAAVVVPTGIFKGKTLGQVAVEKPDSIRWYVDTYSGPNNLLRAAAKYLMDTALSQAG